MHLVTSSIQYSIISLEWTDITHLLLNESDVPQSWHSMFHPFQKIELKPLLQLERVDVE